MIFSSLQFDALRDAARRPTAVRKECFFAYPAFIPQRAGRASETCRATIDRPAERDWIIRDHPRSDLHIPLLHFFQEVVRRQSSKGADSMPRRLGAAIARRT